MFKDYFNSSFSAKNQQRVYDSLNKIPRHLVFTTYNQAIRYRAANSVKRENGRYDDAIFCYDGFFYVVPADCFHRFKLFLQSVARDDSMDKGLAKINAELDSYLDSHDISLDHGFCLSKK